MCVEGEQSRLVCGGNEGDELKMVCGKGGGVGRDCVCKGRLEC